MRRDNEHKKNYKVVMVKTNYSDFSSRTLFVFFTSVTFHNSLNL